ELLTQLIQTDLELVVFTEILREHQSEWVNITTEINRLQEAMDDRELEPFRSLVADRMEGLKKRVVAVNPPANASISACKLLHHDLDNLTAALTGQSLQARPST